MQRLVYLQVRISLNGYSECACKRRRDAVPQVLLRWGNWVSAQNHTRVRHPAMRDILVVTNTTFVCATRIGLRSRQNAPQKYPGNRYLHCWEDIMAGVFVTGGILLLTHQKLTQSQFTKNLCSSMTGSKESEDEDARASCFCCRSD